MTDPDPGQEQNLAVADRAPDRTSAQNLLQSPILLKGVNLSLIYRGKRGPVTALKDLNVTVRKGEFVSIVGPSGCGKSTFLKITAGLISLTSGSLSLYGSPIQGPRSDIGVVFQKANLLPWRTVLSNALINAQVLRMDRKAATKQAKALLRAVGLESFEGSYPWELSGGMQQRVGIVRSLVHDPDLLLMDEPFAALDAMTREQMALELQRLWSTTKKSVIFITHSIPEAVLLSDRVLVMSGRPGTIIEDITIDLPRPRSLPTMATAEFGALCNRLRECFINQLPSA
jgi:NitT/TauT family transport system ATP-binding protein